MAILGNISGKLTNEKIGMAVGAFFSASKVAEQSGTDLSGLVESIFNRAMDDPHFPNIGHVIGDLTKGWNKQPMIDALKITLVGEGLKAVGIGSKYGVIASKLGVNMMKGIAATSLVLHSTVLRSPVSLGKDKPQGNPQSSGNALTNEYSMLIGA